MASHWEVAPALPLVLVTRFGRESISMMLTMRRAAYFGSPSMAAIGSMYSALYRPIPARQVVDHQLHDDRHPSLLLGERLVEVLGEAHPTPGALDRRDPIQPDSGGIGRDLPHLPLERRIALPRHGRGDGSRVVRVHVPGRADERIVHPALGSCGRRSQGANDERRQGSDSLAPATGRRVRYR
jgi:hypothetical protein